LAELLDQLLKQLKHHVAGRKSKMCCVKLRKATRGNPAPVSLYVELLRKAQEVKIIRLSERGYRACVQSP
ncbi:hypothetical protein, partial [Pyrobaculum sp.]|uniref:hypothetical protein n=1 Tax=Pyrobaculum sp. TaxID=2004705 RepID=UPI0031664AB1